MQTVYIMFGIGISVYLSNLGHHKVKYCIPEAFTDRADLLIKRGQTDKEAFLLNPDVSQTEGKNSMGLKLKKKKSQTSALHSFPSIFGQIFEQQSIKYSASSYSVVHLWQKQSNISHMVHKPLSSQWLSLAPLQSNNLWSESSVSPEPCLCHIFEIARHEGLVHRTIFCPTSTADTCQPKVELHDPKSETWFDMPLGWLVEHYAG